MSSYIFYKGTIVEETEATISVKNKSFNYGLGCIEGIRAFWNEQHQQLYLFRAQEHYRRFHRSAKTFYMTIPYSVDELTQWTIELLRKNRFRETVYIRPIAYKGTDTLRPALYDPDNRVTMYCVESKFIGKPALKVSVSSWTRIQNNTIPPWAKPIGGYLNSGLATTEAVLNGFDEAIFLTGLGDVCEGPGENVFILRGNTLITPPAEDNILEGITRDTAMSIARNELGLCVIERSIPRAELYSADEMFFTGTAIGIKPIIEVDRRTVGTGKIGPVTARIAQIYENIVMGNDYRYQAFCTPVYQK